MTGCFSYFKLRKCLGASNRLRRIPPTKVIKAANKLAFSSIPVTINKAYKVDVAITPIVKVIPIKEAPCKICRKYLLILFLYSPYDPREPILQHGKHLEVRNMQGRSCMMLIHQRLKEF